MIVYFILYCFISYIIMFIVVSLAKEFRYDKSIDVFLLFLSSPIILPIYIILVMFCLSKHKFDLLRSKFRNFIHK